jgi:hypothetical protein
MTDTDRSWRCPDCGAEFDTGEAVASHRRVAHGDPPAAGAFICEICDAEFSTREDLEAHRRMPHPIR